MKTLGKFYFVIVLSEGYYVKKWKTNEKFVNLQNKNYVFKCVHDKNVRVKLEKYSFKYSTRFSSCWHIPY